MESKGNWVENLNSQVCVYQIERTVQDRKVKKNGFNKKTPKKNSMIFFLSVIKLIHYEIRTVEKKYKKRVETETA